MAFAFTLARFLALRRRARKGADTLAHHAKLGRVGRFAPQSRSAEGLEALLADYFGLPMAVRPFVGAWLDIPRDLHCRLGEQQLGLSATLGASTWQCQHKFEIAHRPAVAGGVRQLSSWRGRGSLSCIPSCASTRTTNGTGRRACCRTTSETGGLRLGSADRSDIAASAGESPSGDFASAEATACGNRLGWTSWLGARRAGAQDVVIQQGRAQPSATSHTSGARHHG
ncbi:MAG: type VI secretion system baseplate subunit TssG [Gammaproteobacteria bacterium]